MATNVKRLKTMIVYKYDTGIDSMVIRYYLESVLFLFQLIYTLSRKCTEIGES